MAMDQWLVRTSQNWIHGPYPKEKIREMVLQGELTLEDEVCEANGIWIYLHETKLLREHLGVVPPAGSGSDDVTETHLNDDQDVTDPNLSLLPPSSVPPGSKSASGDVGELDDSQDGDVTLPEKPSYLKVVIVGAVLLFAILLGVVLVRFVQF